MNTELHQRLNLFLVEVMRDHRDGAGIVRHFSRAVCGNAGDYSIFVDHFDGPWFLDLAPRHLVDEYRAISSQWFAQVA